MTARFEVEILAGAGVPADYLVRFTTCLVRRFSKLEALGNVAIVGGSIDILDAFEGPFVWEMTPEQLEATPPVGVEFTVMSLSAAGDVVKAVVRLNE
jgi:hypothetical protein